MTQGSNKIFAILLSLALAFLPLQSAFAGVLSLDLSDEHVSHSVMNMDHGVSKTDCDHGKNCSSNKDCDDNGCSSGHCATCVAVPGILGDTKVSQNRSSLMKYAVFNYVASTSFINHLYRPPRA